MSASEMSGQGDCLRGVYTSGSVATSSGGTESLVANPNSDRRRPNRTHRLDVRIGGAEKQRLKEFADEKGVAVSALVLAAVLDVVDADRVPTSIAPAVDTDTAVSGAGTQDRRSELRELTASVDAVGVLVNAVAKHANSDEPARAEMPDDVLGVEDVLTEVRNVVTRVQEWVTAHEATAGGLRPLTIAVNRVANNVGQLARRVRDGRIIYVDALDDVAKVEAVLPDVLNVLEDVQGRLGARVATPDGIKLQRVLSELHRVTAENRQLRKQLGVGVS